MNAPGTPTVSVILVTHNSAATIARCLASISPAAGSMSREIIIMDAGSSDGTLDVIRQSTPTDVLSMENRGFAAAANAAAAKAAGEFLLFLNPDTVLPPEAIERLCTLARLPRVDAVSGILIDERGRAEPAGERFPSLWWYLRRRLPKLSTPDSQLSTPYSVPWLSGAALLVRTAAFRSVGGFLESFFLYYEDINLCHRLRQRGSTLLLDPTVRILHYGGGSASHSSRVRASDEAEDTYFALHRPRWEGIVLRVFRPFLRTPLLPALLLALAGQFVSLAGMVAAVLGLSVVVAAARAPDIGAVLLLASVLAGQLIRLPLPGLEAGVTLTDALLPLVLGGWLFAAGRQTVRRGDFAAWGASVLLPLAAVLPGLFLAAERLVVAEWVAAAGYAARLLLVLALIPLGARVLERPRFVVRTLVVVGVLLSVVGFVQLRLAPSLPPFLLAGFDPHPGRLFSTWLDPNLLGGFLAVVLAVFLGLKKSTGDRHSALTRLAFVVFGVALLAALLLTKSRSSLMALAAAAAASLIVARPWRRLVAACSLGALGLVLVPGFGARLGALSAADPTAQLRVESWRQAIEHAQTFPLFGVGYNAYAFEQLAAGNIRTVRIHSRAGADNSLLTLLATTGFWGASILGTLVAASLWTLVRRARARSALATPALLALFALLAHAQFVHSLVYVHLAVPLALLLGVAFKRPRPGAP